MQQFVQTQWQKKGAWAWLMSPLGLLVCMFAGLKRLAYRRGWLKQTPINVPVIVVGNLTVGGSGKSPLVAYIANLLGGNGYRPGIICRGYKGKAVSWPQKVNSGSDPNLVGDESVMLAQQTNYPVMVGPDRVQSARALLGEADCDVIISDDGFQHLKLARDIDIIVIDNTRGLGNRWCLPAGPLREGASTLKVADMLVYHHQSTNQKTTKKRYEMRLRTGEILALNGSPLKKLDVLKKTTLHAIAGIGHPKRFFNSLREQGFTIIEHAFADHHQYEKNHLEFNDEYAIITTEKDAIKLAVLKLEKTIWVLPVQAILGPAFDSDLLAKLKVATHA